jgi:hypothetical protein
MAAVLGPHHLYCFRMRFYWSLLSAGCDQAYWGGDGIGLGGLLGFMVPDAVTFFDRISCRRTAADGGGRVDVGAWPPPTTDIPFESRLVRMIVDLGLVRNAGLASA